MNLLIEGNNSRLSLRESSEKAANTNATFAERKATISNSQPIRELCKLSRDCRRYFRGAKANYLRYTTTKCTPAHTEFFNRNQYSSFGKKNVRFYPSSVFGGGKSTDPPGSPISGSKSLCRLTLAFANASPGWFKRRNLTVDRLTTVLLPLSYHLNLG